ncbi:peptidoglycan DD-metalloendopeptidase family protein [Sulfurivermis fontis]|jgi:lipoprotein NlpD|uniref:peptidoglycan DD-metalloendopeptidase family protein n=1 Tax=Sulfurivermis fontis TaxID=1972068 RepID=UPI000FD89B99|nr:peptidoglycan DD-metalloendopeptidase family protein [Sulfurivermis fontis]
MVETVPIRHTAVLLLALLLALAGCGELGPPPRKNYAVYHTVRPGETLYSIAWGYGYDYREVASWNRIGWPYRIYPGQRLLVVPTPRGAVVEERSAAARSAAPSPSASRPPPATAKTTPDRTVEKPVSRPHQSPIRWQWPTAGSVKRGFNNSASKKGITIAGRLGQPVYAASGGDVVYSGSGLVGYGNLLIIKHDDTFLSAYGHNRRLLVKEGQKVKPGQMIAEMGETAKDGALLHFEIRQEGKPVDPLRYLPKQNR